MQWNVPQISMYLDINTGDVACGSNGTVMFWCRYVPAYCYGSHFLTIFVL